MPDDMLPKTGREILGKSTQQLRRGKSYLNLEREDGTRTRASLLGSMRDGDSDRISPVIDSEFDRKADF
jgi:hypothetical protein